MVAGVLNHLNGVFKIKINNASVVLTVRGCLGKAHYVFILQIYSITVSFLCLLPLCTGWLIVFQALLTILQSQTLQLSLLHEKHMHFE